MKVNKRNKYDNKFQFSQCNIAYLKGNSFVELTKYNFTLNEFST